MGKSYHNQLVYTIKDKCRVCFTCVRDCPVKAIKIINGQAEVINERCIGCGNCTRVCSQGAKVFLQSSEPVFEILKTEKKKIAIIAPSFPAEFTDIENPKILIGMVKKLGFDFVSDVSFGADLVAKEYKKFVKNHKGKQGGISSDCPAITFYIKQYHPDLVENLIPIVSPMVAMSRVMRKIHGDDSMIVFIGPCVAKKAESPEIDEALTYTELRKIFRKYNINKKNIEPIDFDPPQGGKGSIFPVSHGLLQTAELNDDISDGNFVVADGRINFKDVVKEYENGEISANHLELLCCRGCCIMGPGMSSGGARYARRFNIATYVQKKLKDLNTTEWENNVNTFSQLNLSTSFSPLDRRFPPPSKAEVDKVLEKMGKTSRKDHLNCGACGYDTCKQHAIAIINGYAETEMCLPYSITILHNLVSELNITNDKLNTAQDALIQSEKLAHMGQLSAGIAHELNNPLGVITMYSNLLKEDCKIGDPIREDLDLIVEQTDRCRKIVQGLLNFARKNQVNRTTTNIEDFAKKSIASIIHPTNVSIEFESKLKNKIANIDPDQMMQVLTNLEKNGVEAMNEEGGILKLFIEEQGDEIIIAISDTGSGISEKNMEKIFTPFFTTKGVGKGTGLGLSLIYGIVKMHKGRISVTSNNDPKKGKTGTTFQIVLPRDENKNE